MEKNSPRSEKTYGPYCSSLVEVRMACEEYSWIKCPRAGWQIIDKLQEDPSWAALVAAAIINRCDRMQGGDRILGTLMYKYGDRGLNRALKRNDGKVAECREWIKFHCELSRILCLMSYVMAQDQYIPCRCEPKT